MRVAIIPARGGSKRIPRKNVKPFAGLPMIAWSIKAAIECKCFDHIWVSTEDEEIAQTAQDFGASVPFMRPKELADDHTGTLPVMSHAVRYAEQKGIGADLFCCIYATAPFIRGVDILAGLDEITNQNASFSFSATKYAFPIERSFWLKKDRRVEMVFPDHFNTRSQDLEETWHDAGQFYWGTAEAWKSQTSIFNPSAIAIPLPRHRVQDIDNLEDWKQAELMLEALRLDREK